MVQVPFKSRKQQVEAILARPNATNSMGMINPRVVSREEAGLIAEYKAMQSKPTLFQQRKALTGPQGLLNIAKGTGRGAAEAASIWHEEGVKPTTGAASFLFSPSVREEYRRARGEGQSMREALGTGWDEGLTDTPWGLKGAAELLLDPLNLVPVIGFPGAIARGAGAGARLGARTLAPVGREIAEGVAQMPVPSALRPQRAYAMPPEGSPGSIGARRTEALGKQGTETEKVRFASTMSSGGTVEAGMRPGSIASVHTSELSPARVKAYNEAFGTNYTPKNIADNAALQSLKQSGAQHYHASPVCKNFTKAKTIRTADPNDLAIAKSVARDIREVKPPTISIENVPLYAGFVRGKMGWFQDEKQVTALYKMITKELDNAGYNWDTQIVNAADYGGAQSRTRLILRAVRKDVGELPSLPRQTQDFSQTGRGLDWYATLKDLIDTERRIEGKEMPLKVAFISRTKGKLNDELARINRYIRLGHLTPDRPIITMGGSASKGVPSASNRGSVSPTLLATEKAVPRIIFPGTKGLDNATAIRVTPTMMRRLMGLPDSYVLPQDIYLAKNILGDGVHGAITKNFIQPLVDIIKGNR